MAIQIKNIGKIAIDIKQACDWYTNQHIDITGKRLDAIRNHVVFCLMNTATVEAKSFEKGIVTEKDYYALSDGAAFGLIARELSKLKPHILQKSTIKGIMNGPLVPKDENINNSDGRNKFVELELAANLSSAGIKIIGFDDVAFEFEGVRYLCECKRPFKDSSLDRNIKKAYSQLTNKLGSSKDRGLIAIAVEKIFNLDQSFQTLSVASGASDFALSIAKELQEKVSKYQTEWLDTRIVGILAIIRFLMKTPKISGPSYNLALLIFPSPRFGQKSDYDRLFRLANHLKSNF
jgi:hypothetical protein